MQFDCEINLNVIGGEEEKDINLATTTASNGSPSEAKTGDMYLTVSFVLAIVFSIALFFSIYKRRQKKVFKTRLEDYVA